MPKTSGKHALKIESLYLNFMTLFLPLQLHIFGILRRPPHSWGVNTGRYKYPHFYTLPKISSFILLAIKFQSYFSSTIFLAFCTIFDVDSGLFMYSTTLSAILFGLFTSQKRPVSLSFKKSGIPPTGVAIT